MVHVSGLPFLFPPLDAIAIVVVAPLPGDREPEAPEVLSSFVSQEKRTEVGCHFAAFGERGVKAARPERGRS